MALDLTVLQPKLERNLWKPGIAETTLEEFLQTASTFETIEQVAEELHHAINRVSGEPTEVALVAPEGGGEIRMVSTSLRLTDVVIGDRSAAFAWLGASEEPLWRGVLDGNDDVGGKDTAALMDLVQAEVLVPLLHRGDLLGLILIGSRKFRRWGQREFLKGLRTYATTALANTFLGAEAQGWMGVTKTLGLANAIQAALMPEEEPIRRAGWELCGLFRPMAACGGDLWGWRELPDQKVLIVVADATGHGAGPALLSAVAKGTMDAYAQSTGADCDPSELLASLNQAILRVGQRAYMMTAFAVVVDLRKKVMHFANAAQNFPFLIRGDTLEALVVRGDQLGAKAGTTFKCHTAPVKVGDTILLYTDGIVEAGEPVAEPYGERRFRRLVQKMGPVAAAHIPNRILHEVETFLEGQAIHDDVTLVAFELIGDGASRL
ncbi:MAG: SpoIIE family protein phosphatase [Myxococcales bacterium]|nr:SpoIIE family protein phosphatase [Myxococcales bacterium]